MNKLYLYLILFFLNEKMIAGKCLSKAATNRTETFINREISRKVNIRMFEYEKKIAKIKEENVKMQELFNKILKKQQEEENRKKEEERKEQEKKGSFKEHVKNGFSGIGAFYTGEETCYRFSKLKEMHDNSTEILEEEKEPEEDFVGHLNIGEL